LAWYALLTPDRHVPDQAASLAHAQTLLEHLDQGAVVAIHCRNGIGGRSPGLSFVSAFRPGIGDLDATCAGDDMLVSSAVAEPDRHQRSQDG
jgi:hypothetical protein